MSKILHCVQKHNPRKKHEWTNNSQQHCVIQIVIEKLAVHSKSQERAKKSLIFGRGKTSMIHEFCHAKFSQCAIGRLFRIISYRYLCNFVFSRFISEEIHKIYNTNRLVTRYENSSSK